MVRAPRAIADSDETLAEKRERVGPFSKGRYKPDRVSGAELLLRASRFAPCGGPTTVTTAASRSKAGAFPRRSRALFRWLPPADSRVLHRSAHVGCFEAALHSLVVSA